MNVSLAVLSTAIFVIVGLFALLLVAFVATIAVLLVRSMLKDYRSPRRREAQHQTSGDRVA